MKRESQQWDCLTNKKKALKKVPLIVKIQGKILHFVPCICKSLIFNMRCGERGSNLIFLTDCKDAQLRLFTMLLQSY